MKKINTTEKARKAKKSATAKNGIAEAKTDLAEEIHPTEIGGAKNANPVHEALAEKRSTEAAAGHATTEGRATKCVIAEKKKQA